jgi:hypothetical protein
MAAIFKMVVKLTLSINFFIFCLSELLNPIFKHILHFESNIALKIQDGGQIWLEPGMFCGIFLLQTRNGARNQRWLPLN